MDDEKVVKEMQGSHWVWDAQRDGEADADGFEFFQGNPWCFLKEM